MGSTGIFSTWKGIPCTTMLKEPVAVKDTKVKRENEMSEERSVK
jgi:hypothetical protein